MFCSSSCLEQCFTDDFVHGTIFLETNSKRSFAVVRHVFRYDFDRFLQRQQQQQQQRCENSFEPRGDKTIVLVPGLPKANNIRGTV